MVRKCLSLFFSSLIFLVASSSYAKPLPASLVFQPTVSQSGPDSLSINWSIKPGYFLYKDRIKVKESADSIVHPGTISFPKALIKKNKQGEVYPIYRKNLTLQVPLLASDAGETLLTVN